MLGFGGRETARAVERSAARWGVCCVDQLPLFVTIRQVDLRLVAGGVVQSSKLHEDQDVIPVLCGTTQCLQGSNLFLRTVEDRTHIDWRTLRLGWHVKQLHQVGVCEHTAIGVALTYFLPHRFEVGISDGDILYYPCPISGLLRPTTVNTV
jgi:hypothetical protein